MMLQRLTIVLLGTTLIAGCGDAPREDRDSGAFITLLGDDTLAAESFNRTETGMTADVVLRPPRTTVHHYVLDLDEDGGLRRYEAVIREPGDTSLVRREVFTSAGDSIEIEITEGGETESRTITGGADALPFIDMVHWPFEMMLTRARTSGSDSTAQPLFTGRGTMNFVVRDLGSDSMSVTHPFRGTMGVDVDDEGRLQRLDAGETTRKLTVMRVPEVDVESIAQRFTAHDSIGHSFGPLSGRGETAADIDGASIAVDYGRPSKRGREIFGALVPWGELWRTGANRATHFETSRALQLGGPDGFEVPAGRYTLYTIPESDGGTLIVNRQTGQGGTTYDEQQDLGRIPMERRELSEPVEDFTIAVEDLGDGGVLKLQWDRTQFAVPFTVK